MLGISMLGLPQVMHAKKIDENSAPETQEAPMGEGPTLQEDISSNKSKPAPTYEIYVSDLLQTYQHWKNQRTTLEQELEPLKKYDHVKTKIIEIDKKINNHY